MVRVEFKICATCRNLQVQAQGEEFPGIADTAFTVFHCRVYKWTTREDYLMVPPLPPEGENLTVDPFNCPSWEEYAPE